VRRVVPFLVVFLACAVAVAQEGKTGKPIISDIVVVGGTTITAETVEYYLGVAPGDPYDPAVLRKNFHRFWDSGLIEDLRIDAEEVEPGKIRVIVTVKERPKVTEYRFEGNKKLSNSTLREKIETAGLSLRRNVPLRMSEVQKLRQAILDAYAKEGYASAVVEPKVVEVGPNLREVSFHIDEGAKIRIGRIQFEGNHVYSGRRLRFAMKKLKQKRWYRPFGKKLIWNKETWGEDSENLKKFYMNRGYKDVIVGEPKVELVARNPNAPTLKGKKYRMIVTIPIEEGRKYRLGTLSLAGNTVFSEDLLLRLYEVKRGKTYNYSRIEDGNEAVRNLYQARGYIYAYTNQRIESDPKQPDVANVTVEIYEGDRFRLGRLEFKGNTKTQDKVIRREFRLDEGDWMNMSAFRRSLFKANQLGYFKLTEDPLDFSFDEKNRLVNVTVKGEEVGRTDIQFGAGYSELEHLFFQFMFNTRNFLGRGETLGVAVSSGTQADAYSLSFSEPYFLDRRMVIGGSIYKQSYDLQDQDFQRSAKGGSVFWGFSVGDFGQTILQYGYEDVFARYVAIRQGYAGEDPLNPHRPPIAPPYQNFPVPETFKATYSGTTSSFTPSYGLDSRDDPFDPSQGMSIFGRLRYAGGPLGGDFNYLRPEVGISIFHPLRRRIILAANFEAGIIKPFGGSTIPVYDRYRLGGENSLRGLPYYGVIPRTKDGAYFIDANGTRLGGDRYLQLNLEYQIKVGGPLKFVLFSDIGNTWFETQGWDLGLLRYTAGAEVRIFLPIFQAPLRFIYGINLKPFPDEKRSDFQFSVGTTF
jgi:outer membrane protein insertion porin family